MKWIAGGAMAFAAALLWSAQTPTPDPVLAAMRDEIDRSRKLTVSSLEQPYFIEYLLEETESFSVSASLGGLITRRRQRFREPEIHVRVGDYKFDNTNYAGASLGARYDLGLFPLEDAYAVLRRHFWLRTDAAYKAAVESISRKRAAMRNITQTETLNDFARSEPVKHLGEIRRLAIDEEVWSNRVREVSAVFAGHPEVLWSSVELESNQGGFYLANSEGTEVRTPDGLTYLRIRASAQASDGMAVRSSVAFHGSDAARLPGDAELNRAAESLANDVTALARAQRGEDYSGPVLFEGSAGAQLLAEVLGRSLSIVRRPIMEPGRGAGFRTGQLDGRLGARVLPESFDVVDDPTQKEWRGRPLFGSYEVDREGVVPKPLRLIEKGVLKSYLTTRQPVRGFESSNGRARMAGAFGASTPGMSNLFVSSSDSVPAAELKKKLIDLVQARGKAYGILVRRMDFPSTASLDEMRRLLAGSQAEAYPVSLPVLTYKIFPDGREELVRGLRFRGLSARSLRDILAAGDDSAAFEFLDNTAPFALVGGAASVSQTCVVGPSLLIDDLELHPLEEELPKLPVVPPPPMVR